MCTCEPIDVMCVGYFLILWGCSGVRGGREGIKKSLSMIQSL